MNTYRKLSLLVLTAVAVLQFTRWPFFPQFMDSYYHLHTAWGFNAAGGWSLWDFWEYAPSGRVHLYPPLFHFVLAVFLKLGADPLVLAQWFEALVPLVFLAVLWRFCASRLGDRYAAFVIIIAAASFRFFISLTDHLPSSVAMIFGLLALDRYYRKDFVRCALLLTLSFYTHFGSAWFFLAALALVSWSERSWKGGLAAVLVLLCSAPVVAHVLTGLSLVSRTGSSLNESLTLYLKPAELVLALAGLIFMARGSRPVFPACMLAASAVFWAYPSRLVSGEGYLAVAMLAGFCLETLSEKKKTKLALSLAAGLLIAAPALVISRQSRHDPAAFQPRFFDSAPAGLISARGFSLSVIKPELRDACRVIKETSGKDEIISSNLYLYSVMAGAVSGRAVTDGLFPETRPAVMPDALAVSTLALLSKEEDGEALSLRARGEYGFIPVHENKFFSILKKPSGGSAMKPARPLVTFGMFYCAAAAAALVFCLPFFPCFLRRGGYNIEKQECIK